MSEPATYDFVVCDYPQVQAWRIPKYQTHSFGGEGLTYWVNAGGMLFWLPTPTDPDGPSIRIFLDGRLNFYEFTNAGNLLMFDLKYEKGVLKNIQTWSDSSASKDSGKKLLGPGPS